MAARYAIDDDVIYVSDKTSEVAFRGTISAVRKIDDFNYEYSFDNIGYVGEGLVLSLFEDGQADTITNSEAQTAAYQTELETSAADTVDAINMARNATIIALFD